MSVSALSEKKIAIIGLGLMGGSLALALKGHCQELLALENDSETITFAKDHQIVNLISSRPEAILPRADIIILAAPVGTILNIIPLLPQWHAGSPLVMDIGSTKVQICEQLNTLPERFHAVGGHPMCGKEFSSIRAADGTLFKGATFALCALPSTRDSDRQLSEAIAAAVGASVLWIDALIHDQWVAATSHVPYLVANALAAVVPADAKPLVGPGLRSTSRLAGSNIQMMTDILMTNREAVLNQLEIYQRNLSNLRELLGSQSWELLIHELANGNNKYQEIVTIKERQ